MTHKTYTLSTPDSKSLYVQEWLPENEPKAVILHVHGLGEHSGRMDHWAERFNKEDLAFIGYDQRGHGKSDGKKGDPKKFNKLIEDVDMMMGTLRKKYPKKPIILYGHSLGGNVAINYVISRNYTADALICTSPWLKLVNPPSKALLKIVQLLLKVAPGLTLSNGLNAADISRVPEEVEKYKVDPLVHDRISVGLFSGTYEAGFNALRNVYKINCPFLLMHGTGDKITSHKASQDYVMNTSDRTRLKLWDDAYHELHHESIRDEVFAYIIEWLKEHKMA